MALEAALMSADITPPLGVTMAGYASRTHGATAVADPLSAYALVLRDADTGQATAIVSLDLCSTLESTKQAIRDRATEACGLEPSAIIISTTHTHFGPMVEPAGWVAGELSGGVLPEYREQLIETVAGLIADAYSRLTPARLRAGSSVAEGISFNRRPLTPDGQCANRLRLEPEQAQVASARGAQLWRAWEWRGRGGPVRTPPEPAVEGLCLGVTDPEVVVLRIEGSDGTPLGCVFNFACHPVCGGEDFYAISPDYPGAARKVLEEELGAPAMFLVGAAGDQVPSWREGDARQRVGRGLAGAALMAWECAEEVSGPLSVGSVEAELPLRAFRSAEELEAILEELDDPGASSAWRERFELDMVKRYKGRSSVTNAAQAVAVGEWALVTGPCEIIAEIALRVKQASPVPYTMFASLAGDYLSYMPTDDDRRAGGYEAETTALAMGSAGVYIKSAQQALWLVAGDQ